MNDAKDCPRSAHVGKVSLTQPSTTWGERQVANAGALGVWAHALDSTALCRSPLAIRRLHFDSGLLAVAGLFVFRPSFLRHRPGTLDLRRET